MRVRSVVKFMGLCAVLIGIFSGVLIKISSASFDASFEFEDEALTLTNSFLDQCRQEDETIPDAQYQRLIALCRQILSQKPHLARGAKAGFTLRLNEIELYTFWSIDSYLEDLAKLHAAFGLLKDCQDDLKVLGLWETDPYLTGRCLYLHASIHMLEAYRTSLLPRFGKVLPLLRRARDFLTGFKEEILVLHCLGRVYADLAFDDETERYEELMGNAVRAFEEALALSPQYGSFMQVTLTAQLGNALNNMDEVEKALDMLETALSAVGSGREPNRFLALHLDIAQALTGRYVETSEKSDLLAAERASDRAFLISNSLAPSRVVPHVRFNLAMTLFTIAREKRDPERNAQAIHEIEKVLDIWTLDRFADLHFLAADTLCQFLAVQESMTRNPLVIDRAVSFLVDLVTRYNTEDLRDRRKKPLSVLYGHLSGFYFKRALHEEGEKRQEAYDLSETAARKSKELQME